MDFRQIEWPSRLFVTGIGTDVGKSFATGWLAKEMTGNGLSVITQKFIQTGNNEFSEDIERHREIMGIPPTAEDLCHITAPVIFTYPASPLLASKIDGKELDLNIVAEATETLSRKYSHVLIEGAGGVMVPLTQDCLTIDYIREHRLPTVVVTNGKLGSVSDTLLTLYALKSYGIRIFALVYNPYFDSDRIICDDTRLYLRTYLETHYPDTLYLEMPS